MCGEVYTHIVPSIKSVRNIHYRNATNISHTVYCKVLSLERVGGTCATHILHTYYTHSALYYTTCRRYMCYTHTTHIVPFTTQRVGGTCAKHILVTLQMCCEFAHVCCKVLTFWDFL